MADEPRFDWPAILRACLIIVGGTALVGFAVPPALTLALGLTHTGHIAGNDFFRFGFWAVSWVLTIWQGSSMLKRVSDQIIDDMLVTAVIVAFVLMFVKVAVALIYEPLNGQDELLPVVTALDTGGALVLIVVALIAARVNRF